MPPEFVGLELGAGVDELGSVGGGVLAGGGVPESLGGGVVAGGGGGGGGVGPPTATTTIPPFECVPAPAAVVASAGACICGLAALVLVLPPVVAVDCPAELPVEAAVDVGVCGFAVGGVGTTGGGAVDVCAEIGRTTAGGEIRAWAIDGLASWRLR